MNLVLPEIAHDFGKAAEKAIATAGGVELARRSEVRPQLRATEAAAVLRSVGAEDLDPRSDPDSAAAAGELCRVSGRYVLPYPVPAFLMRDPDGGAPLHLSADGPGRADHGDLFERWVVSNIRGDAGLAKPAGSPLGSKLGPFVTDLHALGSSARPSALEVSLVMTLSSWRILGGVERAVELAVDHVVNRVQFGHPLSELQAVQFQLADAAVARDGLAELCRFTLWRLFADPEGQLADSLALRLQAIDVGRSVLRTAQQLFGAAGFCDEYDISFLCRHLQPDLRLPFGAERTASELFAAVQRDGFDGLFPHGGRR